jgi:hypothetical protein
VTYRVQVRLIDYHVVEIRVQADKHESPNVDESLETHLAIVVAKSGLISGFISTSLSNRLPPSTHMSVNSAIQSIIDHPTCPSPEDATAKAPSSATATVRG